MTMRMSRDVVCPTEGVGVLRVEGIDSHFDVGIDLHLFIILMPNPQS